MNVALLFPEIMPKASASQCRWYRIMQAEAGRTRTSSAGGARAREPDDGRDEPRQPPPIKSRPKTQVK